MSSSHTRPDGSQLPAEHAGDGPLATRGTRGEAGRQNGTLNQPAAGLENPQAALGGADAVQKTSTIVGKGTDPDAAGGTDGRREETARGEQEGA